MCAEIVPLTAVGGSPGKLTVEPCWGWMIQAIAERDAAVHSLYLCVDQEWFDST